MNISGIVLTGSEIKSIRKKMFLFDSFCEFNNNELFIKNVYKRISKSFQ